MRNAWQDAVGGLSESWPVPVPLLRLDHTWVSATIQFVAFRMDWSWLPDHRAQVLDLACHEGEYGSDGRKKVFLRKSQQPTRTVVPPGLRDF